MSPRYCRQVGQRTSDAGDDARPIVAYNGDREATHGRQRTCGLGVRIALVLDQTPRDAVKDVVLTDQHRR